MRLRNILSWLIVVVPLVAFIWAIANIKNKSDRIKFIDGIWEEVEDEEIFGQILPNCGYNGSITKVREEIDVRCVRRTLDIYDGGDIVLLELLEFEGNAVSKVSERVYKINSHGHPSHWGPPHPGIYQPIEQ